MTNAGDDSKSKEVVDVIWEFMDSRPDTKEFYNSFRDVKTKEQYVAKFWVIPPELRFSANIILMLADRTRHWLPQHPYSCLMFRCILYDIIRKFEDEGMDIYIPHGWWTDAVFIDPRWMIKITNGLLGWKGDLSCELCDGGPDHDCPFYLDEAGREELRFVTEYPVSSG